MENIALIESFSEFKGDKKIDRVTLMAIIEDVFRAALKRKFGSDENFDIIINPDKGDLEIWRNRIVVADGEVEDPNEEIELSEARKIEPDFEIGEDVSEEVRLVDLGRRAILALRQNSSAYDAPAASVTEMVDSIVHNRNRILPTVCLLEGEYGHEDIAIGVPAMLGQNGIIDIIELDMNDAEQAMFDRSAALIKKDLDILKSM